eukprot:5669731-Pleurochrysis_carterae.AAC.1
MVEKTIDCNACEGTGGAIRLRAVKTWLALSLSTLSAASKASLASLAAPTCARACSRMRGGSAARRSARGAAVRCSKSELSSICTPERMASLARGTCRIWRRRDSRNQSDWKKTAKKQLRSPCLESVSRHPAISSSWCERDACRGSSKP